MKTTLNKIREHEPCADGWQKLLAYLGKTKADDEPLEITTILDSNGIDDALWCLRAVEGYDRELRLYAVWCARQVQHLLKDQRSLDALDVAERYANGQATEAELKDAAEAAMAAAVMTAYAAENARFTVCNGAKDAAWGACYAAWAACSAAETAYYAAKAARSAREAAWSAAWGACYASEAADTRHEMKQRQEAELRRICGEG